jgi:hypothetical protein
MAPRVDITGKQFGELRVVRHLEGRKWQCKCSCGKAAIVAVDRRNSGHTSSCGHLRLDALVQRSTKHGNAPRGASTSEYRAWCSMISRCTLATGKSWANYGGRGITVCKRWRKFENFLADMGPRPAGTTIERIKNNKGYSPSNCRWATRAEQARNTRRTRFITYRKATKCVSDWAGYFGLTQSTMYYWLGRYGEAEAMRRLAARKREVNHV